MSTSKSGAVLAIDIGNTMTKVGIVDTREWTCRLRRAFPTAELKERLLGVAEELSTAIDAEERGIPIAVANTMLLTPALLEGLRALDHTEHHIAFVCDRHGGTLPLDYDNPAALGPDRIANTFYCRQCHPGRDTIVVSAGTAVTVDLVTASGRFAGGAILPGPTTQLHSLYEATAALPDIPITDIDSLHPGNSTEECMKVGVLASVAGGVDKLVEQVRRTRSGPVDIVATGGAWPSVAGISTLQCTYVPDVTLIGVGAFTVYEAESARSAGS